METIKPLLRQMPNEVLINFMTQHINRFATSSMEASHPSLKLLFGSDDYRQILADKEKQDREDAAVRLYMRNLKTAGSFEHVCCAMILHPKFDRTHFHLIYATRNATGVEVFKDTEKRAMSQMEKERAKAQQRNREQRSRQFELLHSTELHSSSHYESLRDRYLSKCVQSVRSRLEKSKRLSYDEVWAHALIAPMVWESDLNSWLKQWSEQGLLEIQGLDPSERVPKRERGVVLVWTGGKAT